MKIFKVIVIILIVLATISVGVATAGYLYINGKLSKMQQVKLSDNELGISNKAQEDLADFRNIALFGLDSRDDSLDRGNRSDCIIIATINNKTKDVKFTSVYRDTYVQIDGHGLDKITHAYSYGSAQLALNTLNTNLDLNIKEFVTVNFDAVADAVDKLGGVTINVSPAEIEQINLTVGNTALSGQGEKLLNGKQAVAYARIRHLEGGDFKRTERMRTVLEAMVGELKKESVSELNDFMNEMLPKVYTNIKTNDIIALMPSAAKFNVKTSIGWPYKTQGITIDRYYGVPVTLESNVKQLHEEIFEEPNYEPSDTVKKISSDIIANTKGKINY